MQVVGTLDELNRVIEYFNPKYPKQNLSTLKSNECFYILNQVPVNIILTKDAYEKDVKK